MIPKTLHQIWIGPKPAPEEWLKTWREKYTAAGWEYRLWTNEDLEKEDWINRDKMEAMEEWNGKADIMRWEILWRHGGFLVDADAECLDVIPDDFLEHHTFACYEHETERPGLVAAGYVGAEKGSAVMRRCVSLINERPLVGAAWECVGPKLFTEVFGEHTDDVHIFPARTFIPEHFTGKAAHGTGRVYARQFWSSTRRTYKSGQDRPIDVVDPDTLKRLMPIRVEVGSPVYRQPSLGHEYCLLALQAAFINLGIHWDLNTPTGNAMVEIARSSITEGFARRPVPNTHLFMLDADGSITQQTMLKMIETDLPILAIPLRTKYSTWNFQLLGADQKGESSARDLAAIKTVEHKNGVKTFEAHSAGVACMLVKREVIETMRCQFDEELAYGGAEKKNDPFVNLFHTKHDWWPSGPVHIGEDFSFCERARQVGYAINVATNLVGEHDGIAMSLEDHIGKIRQFYRLMEREKENPILVFKDDAGGQGVLQNKRARMTLLKEGFVNDPKIIGWLVAADKTSIEWELEPGDAI